MVSLGRLYFPLPFLFYFFFFRKYFDIRPWSTQTANHTTPIVAWCTALTFICQKKKNRMVYWQWGEVYLFSCIYFIILFIFVTFLWHRGKDVGRDSERRCGGKGHLPQSWPHRYLFRLMGTRGRWQNCGRTGTFGQTSLHQRCHQGTTSNYVIDFNATQHFSHSIFRYNLTCVPSTNIGFL